MSLVNIINVEVHNNPCGFDDPFRFEITFEVIAELQEDLEFKVVYVGSAESEDNDQTLESLLVGPVPVGTSKFILEAPAPDPRKIPAEDVVGVTVILLMCSYREKEFVRVGYYVNNDYLDEELRKEPPKAPILEKLQRSILADKPRVTRFSIPWDTEEKQNAHVQHAVSHDNASAMETSESADNSMGHIGLGGMTGMDSSIVMAQ
ncbi:Histone chaperone asf1 [Gaertneriomyces sp. JEL0708]|nr:Histone chaperone asf1 [Gaertneriomyces sp. JEL0708]